MTAANAAPEPIHQGFDSFAGKRAVFAKGPGYRGLGVLVISQADGLSKA
jgi:hypothetical protein